MDMYFCPLYSGSSGNALFCQYGETRLLIDAGKSGKTIEEALSSIGADIRTISGVLITHEHSDHISGAGVLARKYHLPLYATRETWWAMKDKIGKIPPDTMREIEAGKDFWLGDIGVVPFSIPHDAADPVGFRLYGGKMSVATATDLGVFSEDVYANVAGSTLVLLESNHDPDMLRTNPKYSAALLRLIGAGTRDVILGHLSGENNTPTLARRVSTDTLEREGIRTGEDVRLQVALRDEVGQVYTLKERI